MNKGTVKRVIGLCMGWMFVISCLAFGPPFLRMKWVDNGHSVTILGWRQFADLQWTESSQYAYDIPLGCGVVAVFFLFWWGVHLAKKYGPGAKAKKVVATSMVLRLALSAAAIGICTAIQMRAEDAWVWDRMRNWLIIWITLSGIPLAEIVMSIMVSRMQPPSPAAD